MNERKPYHRSKQRSALQGTAARNSRDAVRLLALRCGLIAKGQRATVERQKPSLYTLTAGARSWTVDMLTQDYIETTQ